jgi:hypothetical protein
MVARWVVAKAASTAMTMVVTMVASWAVAMAALSAQTTAV